jgi:hypothetical protein
VVLLIKDHACPDLEDTGFSPPQHPASTCVTEVASHGAQPCVWTSGDRVRRHNVIELEVSVVSNLPRRNG